MPDTISSFLRLVKLDIHQNLYAHPKVQERIVYDGANPEEIEQKTEIARLQREIELESSKVERQTLAYERGINSIEQYDANIQRIRDETAASRTERDRLLSLSSLTAQHTLALQKLVASMKDFDRFWKEVVQHKGGPGWQDLRRDRGSEGKRAAGQPITYSHGAERAQYPRDTGRPLIGAKTPSRSLALLCDSAGQREIGPQNRADILGTCGGRLRRVLKSRIESCGLPASHGRPRRNSSSRPAPPEIVS